MASLYVKCKTCGVEFKAGIEADKVSFDTLSIINFNASCPNDHKGMYQNKDFYLKE